MMAFTKTKDLYKKEMNIKPNNLRHISIYWNGACIITKNISKSNPTAELEIDFDEKIIRVRTGEGLQNKLTGRVGTSFSCPKAVHSVVIPRRDKKRVVELTEKPDGWWYGSYGEKS